MVILSLDLGSTNYKAAVFDECLNRLAECAVPVDYTVRDIILAEMDAGQTWRLLTALIRQVIQDAGLKAAAVTHITISSQAQTFALIGEDGAVFSPFFSWLDNRAESLSLAVRQELGDFHTYCSFPVPFGQLALLKLLWLREHAPAMLAHTRQVAFLPSWFVQRLGGAMVIDRNLAAMSGLYSLPAAGWWSLPLALCGLTPQQLPELMEIGETRVITKAGNDSGLCDGINIALCGNDQTCGAVGSGLQAGEVLVTLGTALVAYRLAGRHPGPYHPAGCWGPYPGGGFYELGVAQGTAALDWACQSLLPGHEVIDFMAFAENALPDRSFAPPEVFFYPDLMGTPQAWQGEETPSRRALAVLEGIAFSLSRLVSSLHTRSDKPVAVRAVGGGSRSDLWLQLLADILGIPVSRNRGDALLGAARQLLPGVNPPGGSNGAIYAPRPDWAGFYQERLVRWLSHNPSGC